MANFVHTLDMLLEIELLYSEHKPHICEIDQSGHSCFDQPWTSLDYEEH